MKKNIINSKHLCNTASSDKNCGKIEFFLVVFWCVLCFGLSVFLIFQAVSDTNEYNAVKDKLITLTANVCKIDEHRDSDGDKEYSVSVRYYYNDRAYTSYFDTTSRRDTYDFGQEVTVTINPDNPDKVYKYTESTISLAILFSVLLFCGGVMFGKAAAKKNPFLKRKT